MLNDDLRVELEDLDELLEVAEGLGDLVLGGIDSGELGDELAERGHW